jgi:von willebrand factor type A domain
MKKKIALTIFLIIMMMTTSVFATAKSADVKMEVVEDNVCTIKLNEKANLEKKLVEYDLDKHQVTLQLKVNNAAEAKIPSGEMMLVIDSSNSMDQKVDDNTTRKELVLNSANKLVESLLKANPTTLKIGVVTFSTSSQKDENGNLIIGTEADAQKVCDFTNNVQTLKSKISAIEGTGQYTNLDSGLKLAKSQYTSEDNNKYMIVLTDGLPNIAIGYNDLTSYKGLTDVITATKATLKSLDNVDVMTMLTGIDTEDATFRMEGENKYTYGQVIQEVFGTESKPTVGKFYKINDNQIEKTITETIYRELLPVENALTDIVVKDYFPEYIVNNFEMTYVEGIDTSNVSAKIDTETNSITWNLAKLGANQSAMIQYRLTLKDEFDEKIIGEILNTNDSVEVTYKDFDGSSKTEKSDVTPKIKLTKIEVPVDNTVAPEPIPKAGSPMVIVGMILVVAVAMFFGYKSRKIK